MTIKKNPNQSKHSMTLMSLMIALGMWSVLIVFIVQTYLFFHSNIHFFHQERKNINQLVLLDQYLKTIDRDQYTLYKDDLNRFSSATLIHKNDQNQNINMSFEVIDGKTYLLVDQKRFSLDLKIKESYFERSKKYLSVHLQFKHGHQFDLITHLYG